MAQFVQVADGQYIRADLIERIYERKVDLKKCGLGRETETVVVVGDESHVVFTDADELVESLAPVIPAQPGWQVICACLDPDGWRAYYTPIIGWSVQNGYRAPVLALDATTRITNPQGVLRPDGVVVIPFVEEFKSVAAWLEDVKAQDAAENSKSAKESGDANAH